MNFIRNLFFSWLDKDSAISDEDLPSTEPSILKHDNEIRKKEINKSRLIRLKNASKKENNNINTLTKNFVKGSNNKLRDSKFDLTSNQYKKSEISSPSEFKLTNSSNKEQSENQTKTNFASKFNFFSTRQKAQNTNVQKDSSLAKKENNESTVPLEPTSNQISDKTSNLQSKFKQNDFTDKKSNEVKLETKLIFDSSSSSDSDEIQLREKISTVQPKIEFNYTSKAIKKIESLNDSISQELELDSDLYGPKIKEVKSEQKLTSSSDSEESQENEKSPIAHPRIDFNFTPKIIKKIEKLKEEESDFDWKSDEIINQSPNFEFTYNKTKVDDTNKESEATSSSDSDDSPDNEKTTSIRPRIEFNDDIGVIEKLKFTISPDTKLNSDFKSYKTTENNNDILKTTSSSDSDDSQATEKAETAQPRIDFDHTCGSNKATLKSKLKLMETSSSSDSEEMNTKVEDPKATSYIQFNNSFKSNQKIESTKTKLKSETISSSDSDELPTKINFNYNFKTPETELDLKSRDKTEENSKKLSTSDFVINIDLDRPQITPKEVTTPSGFMFSYTSDEIQTTKQPKTKMMQTSEFTSFNNISKTQPVKKSKTTQGIDQTANSSNYMYNFDFDDEQSFEGPNKISQFDFSFNHNSKELTTPSGFKFSFVSEGDQNITIPKTKPSSKFSFNSASNEKLNTTSLVTPKLVISSNSNQEQKAAPSRYAFNHISENMIPSDDRKQNSRLFQSKNEPRFFSNSFSNKMQTKEKTEPSTIYKFGSEAQSSEISKIKNNSSKAQQSSGFIFRYV